MSAWGVFLFSAKYDRTPLSPPRKERRRGELSAHPRAAFESSRSFPRRAFLTAPLARRSLLPISGEYRPRRGDLPVLHENRVTAAPPLPAAKETPAREIVRSSARGFRIISQLSAPGFLTAPLARRSLLPVSGEYRPRWGDLPLHAGAARIFAFCRAWTRAFCRETLAFPTLIWYINGVFMK